MPQGDNKAYQAIVQKAVKEMENGSAPGQGVPGLPKPQAAHQPAPYNPRLPMKPVGGVNISHMKGAKHN